MDISKKFIESGYKLTKPRSQVLNSLKKEKSLISARNLHKKIKNVDRASIYRTLNLFEKLNIVNVEIIEKEKLYCLADHPHHHIICRKCGYTEEFDCDNKEFKKFNNFSNIHHRLTLTGVCNKCNPK
jgi:Fur family ferric uptake transcriptional regulator